MNINNPIPSLIKLLELSGEKLKTNPRDIDYNDFLAFCVDYYKNRTPHLERLELIKIIKNAGGLAYLKDAYFPVPVSANAVKVKAKAKDNRRQAEKIAVEEVFTSKLEELAGKIFTYPLNVPKIAAPKSQEIDRNLHLLISDTHFGAKLDSREGVLQFGHVEEARRLAQIVLQAAEYKPQYRKNTKLIININGDIIQGQLHDPRDGEPLAEQAATAMFLLKQAIFFLAGHFPKIEINCATGNHDRNTARHKDRATLQKWDSIATIVYYGLKHAISPLSNVTINIPRTPWVSYKSFDVNYYGTHGDTNFKVPNPGSSINVSMLENQINKLNASLADKDEYKVVFIGHIHTGLLIRLNNGVTLVTNPPLIPVDSFAKSIGIFEAPTGQWLWESVQGHPFGDSRFLTVDHSTDKDKSLDKIIKPFVDF